MAKAATDSWWTRARNRAEFDQLHKAELERIVENGDGLKSKDFVVSAVSQSMEEAAAIAGVRVSAPPAD